MNAGKSRLVGIAAAAILALVGGVLLWQNSGDSESSATEAPVEKVDVLVAATDITRGETAASLVDDAYVYVKTQQVLAEDVKPGAISSLTDLSSIVATGSVTSRNVPAGAQLTSADFVIPGEQDMSALPNVDESLFEVTIALEPQRVVGGTIRAGQYVAVVGSFPPQNEEPEATVVIADQVLVTNVQTEQLFTEQQLDTDPLAPSLAPSARLYITVGVDIDDLETITYAAEFGQIWLARQGSTASTADSAVRSRGNIVLTLAGDGLEVPTSTPEG